VRIVRFLSLLLLIVGIGLMGYAIYQVAEGKIYQAWRGRELDRALENLPPRPPRQGFTYAPGSAIGRLEIPRLGLSVVVLEGSDDGTLKLGVVIATRSSARCATFVRATESSCERHKARSLIPSTGRLS
jgi:sortase (surface protein transpeptidase)